MAAIAAFTIFMHFDGYWVVDSAMADAVIAQPERYAQHVDKATTKLAACRMALVRGQAGGAQELHLEGAGVTHSALTEIRRAGLVPVLVDKGRQTDLTAGLRTGRLLLDERQA
jgi:hypothetical protein